MSKIWSFIMIISIIIAMLTGNVNLVVNSIMEGSKSSVENVINLIGMMCFWGGIFKIFSETMIIKKFSKKFSKILYCLFDKKELNENSIEAMSLNITSNILGVGNAATINGIKAVKELQELNPKKDKPSNNMTTFILLNTASLQIVPTTMIALRTLYHSSDPSAIILPVWIVTFCSLTVGIFAIKILNKRVI